MADLFEQLGREALHISDSRVWAEICYLDSPSDFSEHLPPTTAASSPPTATLVMLDERRKRARKKQLAMVLLVIAFLLITCIALLYIGIF